MVIPSGGKNKSNQRGSLEGNSPVVRLGDFNRATAHLISGGSAGCLPRWVGQEVGQGGYFLF